MSWRIPPGRIRWNTRRALLSKNPRSLALLNLAAEKAGWGAPLPARVGRGMALGEPFGSRVCAIVEVEVTAQGEVRLRRVVVALDCGDRDQSEFR